MIGHGPYGVYMWETLLMFHRSVQGQFSPTAVSLQRSRTTERSMEASAISPHAALSSGFPKLATVSRPSCTNCERSRIRPRIGMARIGARSPRIHHKPDDRIQHGLWLVHPDGMAAFLKNP